MRESTGKTRSGGRRAIKTIGSVLHTTDRLAKPLRRAKPKPKPRPANRTASSTRLGDVAAAARLLTKLDKSAKLTSRQQRQLLAALCKLIGYQVTGGIHQPTDPAPVPKPALIPSLLIAELSPRQHETLLLLLKGDAEKQIARKLKLSTHTVHVYVKSLYRHFKVTSRGELLALFVEL